MRFIIPLFAALLLAAFILALAVYIAMHMERPAEIAVTQASAGQPAWRLFSVCPVGRRQIPVLLPDERKA